MSIINKIKWVLGISSPSSVFYNIARDIVQGLINGWNDLFGNFTDLIGAGIGAILDLFAPFLALFGVDVSQYTNGSGTLGTHNTGGVTTTSTGSSTGSGTVTNNYNFYGTVYMSGVGPEGTYDCATSPVITSTNTTIPTYGY
jgi:hypothetical protein